MKYSTRLSDAVHLLLFVHLNSGQPLSSEAIAKSICTNPSYVGRAAEDISLLDVYRAVEGEKRLLHLDTHTNPDCGVGVHIQYALQGYFDRVQQETERAMQQITLQNVLDTYHQEISYGGHTEN